MVLVLFLGAGRSFAGGALPQGVACIVNGILLVYALSAFVGLKDGYRDVRNQIRVSARALRTGA